MVVARLHADVGAGQAAAVDRRHRRLQVDVEAHDLRLLEPFKEQNTLASQEGKKRNSIQGTLTTQEELVMCAKLTSETRLRALCESHLLPDKVTLLSDGE